MIFKISQNNVILLQLIIGDIIHSDLMNVSNSGSTTNNKFKFLITFRDVYRGYVVPLKNNMNMATISNPQFVVQ